MHICLCALGFSYGTCVVLRLGHGRPLRDGQTVPSVWERSPLSKLLHFMFPDFSFC